MSGSPGIVILYKRNMTQKGTLLVANVQDTDKVVYQLLEYDSTNNADYYVVDYAAPDQSAAFKAYHKWFNWQYIGQ